LRVMRRASRRIPQRSSTRKPGEDEVDRAHEALRERAAADLAMGRARLALDQPVRERPQEIGHLPGVARLDAALVDPGLHDLGEDLQAALPEPGHLLEHALRELADHRLVLERPEELGALASARRALQ